MGSGCLRPPQSIGQINLSVLDTIYEDVKDIERSTDHNQYTNLKIYEQISQRISKKGQLKKLCDYLSSHRSRICQTMLHSYRITNQSKIYIYKYVAIIVMEAIINSIPKHRINIENFGKTCHSSFRQSINKKMDTSQKQINYQNNMISKSQNSQQQSKNINKNQSRITNQITSHKFQGIYFNFIATLLKQGGLIYKLTLQNLTKFSQLSDSIFSSQTQVLEIIKIIKYHIENNEYLHISLKAYFATLNRIRQSYFAQNTDILKSIFRMWNSNAEALFSLDSVEPQRKLQVSDLCTQIIEIFIKKCVESYQYDPIIEAFFQFFDQNCFRNVTRGFNLLFQAISQLQLKNQFNKSLIRFLIAYVGFPQCKKQKPANLRLHSRIQQFASNEEQNQNANIFQKKWTQIFKMGNSQNFRKKFKNIRNRESKLNSIPTISIWIIQQHLVEMSQLLTYSGLNLIYSYSLNMISSHQAIRDKANDQLLHFVTKITDIHKTKILQLIMSQVEESPAFDDDVRSIMLTLCQKIVHGINNGFYVPSNNSHIIQIINDNHCFENNKKMLQLMGRVLQKLAKQCINENLQKICEMYKSLIKEIIDGFSNADQKVELLQQINNKFSNLPNYFKGINLAFLQLIQSWIIRQSTSDAGPENSLLFLDFLFVKISKICNLGVRNQNLENYLQEFTHKRDLQKIQLLEKYSKDRFSMNIDLPLKERKKLQFYNESVTFFKKKHKESHTEPNQNHGEYCSIGDSVHTKRDSVYTIKGDQDFQDTMGIIKFV